ncbi:MAG: FMN-binding glutamate synthase family protein [Halobacteriovoraceae bacterium]|jgi:glutamate synthase domain-containing protein 2|nr:FMN-binding glutamate synthase family protein [Halobacteriovoraceae bacterium]
MENFWLLIQANPFYSISAAIGGLVVLVAIYDIFIQKNYPIIHNFPVLGHIRYFMILVGPELRQYWVANDKEELPFNRSEREWITNSGDKKNNTFGFGTSEVIYSIGYPIIKNAAFPFPDAKAFHPGGDPSAIPCIKVMGEAHKRKRPYRPKSLINISAMSFGSLSRNAISSLNKGAILANCYHNTGEGSASDYHLLGADLMWQIGTGYFGCRNEDGSFNIDKLKKKVEENPQIRTLEIKLSQGAKPGKGGILPGSKVTEEISRVRQIPLGRDCYSPNSHSEFSTPDELIDFVEKLAEASGVPVGIKAAIGKLDFWEELAKRMKERGEGPDFITIDGGEGGTGAAPLTFSDHVSLPFKIGFSRVYNIFQEAGISKDIVWIGSGKLGFPDRAIIAFAMGVDLIHIAREAMISVGCIQAQKCHTGECPAGIATQNSWLQAGVNVEKKSKAFANYMQSFRKELLSLSHAAGYEHPLQFTGADIEFSSGVNKFSPLDDILCYKRDSVEFTTMRDYCAEFTD